MSDDLGRVQNGTNQLILFAGTAPPFAKNVLFYTFPDKNILD